VRIGAFDRLSLIVGLFFGGDWVDRVVRDLVRSVALFISGSWRRKSDPWFAKKLSGKAPPFVIPVTVVLTLFYSVATEDESHNRRQAMSGDVRDLSIRSRSGTTDAETGEVIQYLGIKHPDRNLDEIDLPEWIKGTRGGGGSLGRYSRGPFEFQGSAKGLDYERITF
jgi:hypothetical protein